MFFKLVVSLLSCSIFSVIVSADVSAVIRDPSAPFFSEEKKIKKISQPRKDSISEGHILSSVFIGKSKKIAVIDDKSYREGDKVGAYIVKRIDENEVHISSSSHTKTLEIFPVNKTGFIIK